MSTRRTRITTTTITTTTLPLRPRPRRPHRTWLLPRHPLHRPPRDPLQMQAEEEAVVEGQVITSSDGAVGEEWRTEGIRIGTEVGTVVPSTR